MKKEVILYNSSIPNIRNVLLKFTAASKVSMPGWRDTAAFGKKNSTV
jgi:hypothetical protein